jgi:tetratricopeptide (TPR) repeat protein
VKTASGDGARRWPAIAALAALLLAAGAVAAIALTGGTSDRTTARSPSATTSGAKKQRTTSSSRSTSTQQKQTTTQAQSTPTTSSAGAAASGAGGDPKALNDRGFALIGQGDDAAAVPLLQQSVQGFRAGGRTGEIDYAFALFNLATALRATGHPDQAIPLLEERLQRSDYKRAEVQRELAAARQQAGQPASGAAAGGGGNSGPGKGGKRDKRGPGNGQGDD